MLERRHLRSISPLDQRSVLPAPSRGKPRYSTPPSPEAGYAMRAPEPVPGTLIGKSLEALESGQGVLAVYVAMQ